MPRNAAKPRETYHVGNLEPQLLIQAKRMLEEVGPTKISIRAIAEQLGVSATAVYYHFANKDELLSRLAATGFSELEFVLNQALAESTATTILKEVSLAYFRFAKRNPTMYQLMFGSEITQATLTPELERAREQAFQVLKQTIAQILDQEIHSKMVRITALSSWSHIHGMASLLIHQVIVIPETIDEEQLVENALQSLKHLFSLIP